MVLRLGNRFVLQNTIHWVKAITIEDDNGELFHGVTSSRSVRHESERLPRICFSPDSGGPHPDRPARAWCSVRDKSNIARWNHTGGKDRRCRGNTWFVPYETIMRRDRDRPHPATFPVGLAENCIRLHGLRNDLVMLDPFLGIGNSAVAAQRCGVKEFIGFEIDGKYLAEAKRRSSI